MNREDIHRATLEEEATHITDEARMVLPGVQVILGFQLIAIFNQRFEQLTHGEQLVHLASFLLTAMAMGLIMAPAAYHRLAERDRVSRRFVDLSSKLLCAAMLPFIAAVALDAYLVSRLILHDTLSSLAVAGVTAAILGGLWFGLPLGDRRRQD
jgi:hypothetical protein